MTPADVGTLVGRVTGMLPFFALVGMWIQRGDGRRAWRALASMFGAESAWEITDRWPSVLTCERTTGWTPEFWACRLAIEHVRDWESRDWTREIYRWCGELGDAEMESKPTR